MKEICADRRKIILLGSRGEHLARCVTFDMIEWQRLYGEGTVQLLAQRNGDEAPYPCAVTVKDGMARWEIRDVDVAMPGEGKAELQYHVGGAVVKSEAYRTLTMNALGDVGPVPPSPEKDWVETVLQAANDAEESAKAAKNAIKQTITPGENGNWFIDGEDSGVRAVGRDGDSGLPVIVSLAGAVQSLQLANHTDYRCMDPVTDLTVTGFGADPNGRSEAWSIHFAAGARITVVLPDCVVWNYGATPVFAPGNEYHLMFVPLLNGNVLGVWSEVAV